MTAKKVLIALAGIVGFTACSSETSITNINVRNPAQISLYEDEPYGSPT